MQTLINDFDHDLEQIGEIEEFNRAKVEKIAREIEGTGNIKNFQAIIESQTSLGELERQIDRKIALKQSDSSAKGLSTLPQIEKTLDDLIEVT